MIAFFPRKLRVFVSLATLLSERQTQEPMQHSQSCCKMAEYSGMWFRDKKNRRTACRETWDIQSSFLEVVSHGGSNNSQRQTIPVFRRPPQAPRSVSFPGPAGRSRTFRHCQCGLCQSTVQVDAG